MEPKRFDVQMSTVVSIDAETEEEAIEIARKEYPDLDVDDVWEIG